ncbi:hydroxyisourate hydrolase [Bradyrhizobium daqingense]|uniref:hydroxyisourate hydrolase n=1 Tax=Bradyrhizobium daqingense TaxID=993502 RepID=UPI00142EDAD3|nr:hydroxyisourate hydrolase [Bradyrhizobium daqingense]UFS86122.1 hydroxyisourate hydrolase [Bradyrhizobium daqingense]
MAGGISIHAVDVASGRPANGLRVEIWRIDPEKVRLVDGRLGANGALDHAVAQGARVTAGEYEVLFHLGEFFGDGDAFLTVTPFRFRIKNVDEHFHLPLKFTRWGYSLFRGA